MNHVFYLHHNISINTTLQQNEGVILIKLKYSKENQYSSFFNLENLKNIDILFGGYPPLTLSEAYTMLCDYLKDNSIIIIELSNSKAIFEIEKDIKPNMRFELKRENNTYNDNIIINNSINNIGNINNNYFMNYNRNIDDYNYINYNGNMNNNNNMNCNGNMNKNKNNNYNNTYTNSNGYNNELINNMINKDMERLQHTENVGGVKKNNISDNNISFNIDKNSFCQNSINNDENNNSYLYEKQNQVSSSFNVRVAQPKNNQRVIGQVGQVINLNCLLRFLLLEKISNKNENISDFGNCENVKEILKFLNNNQDSKGNKNSNQDNNFKDDKNSKEDKNILEYLKYLDNVDLNLNSLIDNLFKEKQELKKEIINYCTLLSKYEEHNNDFEHKLFEDLKNCHLDYSIVDMNILERDNSEEYEQKKKECKNMKKLILYFLSEMNSDFNKLNFELKYYNKSIYGKGFYFSNSIDYIVRCLNRENILKTGETFSLLVCEIFYDEEKLKEFDIYLSSSNSSQNSSSSEEEKVEPDGLIKVNNCYLNDNNSKIIINIEYVLSEKYQIFPLYKFTLKRNEFLILYRDPNFIGKNIYSKYLNDIVKKKSLKYSKNMNFYFISSTEEALKLLLKKKKQKVILITSIGRDKSGKRFVEIVRKILKFDLIVLFFSNNTNHFNWIKDFSNCLYTETFKIYEDYISNYKEDALKELKKTVENKYQIKLKDFSFDFLCYSNYDDDLNSSYFDYNSNCPYFRSVYIFNPNKNLYISMTKEGKVKKSEEKCIWEITLINNDITLFSNGFYLNIDKNKEIAIGSKEMKKWDLKIDDNCYYFFNSEGGKINYLSMEDDEDIRINDKKPCKISIFILKDHI